MSKNEITFPCDAHLRLRNNLYRISYRMSKTEGLLLNKDPNARGQNTRSHGYYKNEYLSDNNSRNELSLKKIMPIRLTKNRMHIIPRFFMCR